MEDNKRRTEQPKSLGVDDVLGERFSHPAYGMIRIGQAQGSAILVGSSVKHNNFVTLEISEAVKNKTSYREGFFSDKIICQISMSHAQLAEMLFSTNSSGVPCTLRYVRGDKELRPEPPFVSPLKENTDDLHAVLKKTLHRAAEMAQEIEAIVTAGNMKKEQRERVKFLALKVHQDINSNMHFAMQCVDEKTENIVAHAKAEIESFISMTFKNAGIEHFKNEMSLLEDKSEVANENML